MTKSTPHIQPNGAKIAKTVLMPGDPLRAKYIADNYLENVEQFKKMNKILDLLDDDDDVQNVYHNWDE